MMQIADLYNIYKHHPIICTDTRSIQQGGIFFCLKGGNFDGNTFAKQALDEGCSFVVVDDPSVVKDNRYVLFENALIALQALATYHRQQLKIPVIGITGSNGKTTTKELLASVLRKQYKVHFTKGNLNNHIGVPLTLLQIGNDIEMAVIEMGANHPGEIAQLCEFAKPTHGLITNVGKAHLEGFGSFEGVKKTKKELYDYISLHGGTIFYNADNSHLAEMADRNKDVKKYSMRDEQVYCYGHITNQHPYLSVSWNAGHEQIQAKSHLVGAYNAENILAAVAIGRYFNIPEKLIKQGIEEYQPQNNRSQIIEKNGNTIIMDAYNANPSSMEQAIDNLSTMVTSHRHKRAVLGDMLELGNYSAAEHIGLIEKLIQQGFKDVILVGSHFLKASKEIKSPYTAFNTTAEAMEWLKLNSIKDALILIKGSRGIKLETIIDVL